MHAVSGGAQAFYASLESCAVVRVSGRSEEADIESFRHGRHDENCLPIPLAMREGNPQLPSAQARDASPHAC